MSWKYPGNCLECGKPASFVEPNKREYTCKCGDAGILLDSVECRVPGRKHFFQAHLTWPTPSEFVRFMERIYLAAWGKKTDRIDPDIAEKIAAGSEAYSCPGSRPESPPGGRAPKGPSRGNSRQSLPTLEAFNGIIDGIESLRDRGKLGEERLRTIVSELITLIYRDNEDAR